MIKGFRDKETEKVFNGRLPKRLPHDIQRIAERKLIMLHRSATSNDLHVPPSNYLEPLKGARKGQHNMRINKIVHGKRGISADTALRLARYFGMSVEFWTGIQTHYEVELAKMDLADRLEKEVKVFVAA